MPGCSPKRQIKACYRCLSRNILIKKKKHIMNFAPKKKQGDVLKLLLKLKQENILANLGYHHTNLGVFSSLFSTTEMPQQPESARSFTIRMTCALKVSSWRIWFSSSLKISICDDLVPSILMASKSSHISKSSKFWWVWRFCLLKICFLEKKKVGYRRIGFLMSSGQTKMLCFFATGSFSMWVPSIPQIISDGSLLQDYRLMSNKTGCFVHTKGGAWATRSKEIGQNGFFLPKFWHQKIQKKTLKFPPPSCIQTHCVDKTILVHQSWLDLTSGTFHHISHFVSLQEISFVCCFHTCSPTYLHPLIHGCLSLSFLLTRSVTKSSTIFPPNQKARHLPGAKRNPTPWSSDHQSSKVVSGPPVHGKKKLLRVVFLLLKAERKNPPL